MSGSPNWPPISTAALAAKAATSTIPIVFGAGGDPVKQGLVASFNRPGGNLTGVNFFTAELVAKRMQLLRELVPAAKRVAVLVNPTDLEGYATLHDAEAAAGGLQILVREVTSGRDIDAAFASMTRENADAVLVAPGTFFNTRRVQLAILAARHVLPATYPVRAYAEVGGLASYGADILERLGLEHWTRRLVSGHSAQCLSATTPMAMPRNNKKNAGIQFGSNGTTYLHPVPEMA